MTQGRDGISLAQRVALRCPALARQLSVMVAAISVVALVVGTAGTSFAGKPHLHDTVVVSNFGALFAGSIETFAVGSINTAHPTRKIIGPTTKLGSSNGASGLAQSSSANHEIAVALTLGLPVPPFVEVGGQPVACPADCHIDAANGTCAPKTQFDCITTTSPGSVAIFPQGATGDSAPSTLIDGNLADILNNTVGGLADPVLLNFTGLFLPQGVAFANPFVDRATANPGAAQTTPTDLIAVSDLAPVVVGSTTDFITCGVTTLPTIGQITEYEVTDSGNIAPLPRLNDFESDNTAFEVPLPAATVNPPNTPSDLPTPFFANSSIAGCNTFLFLPVGITFDSNNDLWVVNSGVTLPGPIVIPPFVSEFDPDAAFEGDATPIDIIGLEGPTAGAFTNPLYIAVGPDPSGETCDGEECDQFIFVTDTGSPAFVCKGGSNPGTTCNSSFDETTCTGGGICRPPENPIPPSIKIFDTDLGIQTGSISGPKTRLVRPEGIALSGPDLYVVSNNSNSLLMFRNFSTSGGNIAPKVDIQGVQSGMNFPVGVALPQFTAPLINGSKK